MNFDFLGADKPDPEGIRINARAANVLRRQTHGRKQNTKTQNVGVGCLVFTVVVVGCVYLTGRSADRAARRLARDRPQAAAQPAARIPRPDDYVPPPLGPDPRRYFSHLYRDLMRFGDDPHFREVGFSQGQRFFPWLEAVQKYAIEECDETERAWGEKWIVAWIGEQNRTTPHDVAIPGELLHLGLNAKSKQEWPFDEVSRVWDKKFGGKQ